MHLHQLQKKDTVIIYKMMVMKINMFDNYYIQRPMQFKLVSISKLLNHDDRSFP